MNAPALPSGENFMRGQIMTTKAAPIIGASRPRLAGDILWLGFTGLVLALILGIMCWPLSAELSPRNTASTAPDKPTATLASGVGTSSAATAPLPALAGGASITRLGTLITPPDDNSEGAHSPATAEPGRTKSQSAHPASAAHIPVAHRPRPHHPRVRPSAPDEGAQLTPPCGSSLPPC
jgi:hypothetical protein